MALQHYFEEKSGLGILSTANEKGVVNTAVYARPHVMDENTIAFVMANRLSHANLEANPHAAYLFKEDGHGYRGKRLLLTKIKEEKDTDLLNILRRRTYSDEEEARMKPLSLVYFRVDEERPLVGAF